MAKQGSSQFHPQFFRVILPCDLESEALELPTNFVKNHGKHLSKHACLKLPTGAESKMKVKKFEDRAWLHKGWQELVEKYSIKCGYFLIFRYEGGSRFSVLIFDLSATEINYSVSSPSTRDKNAGKCKFMEAKEEDSGDEISDECPPKGGKSKFIKLKEDNANRSRKLNTGQHSRASGLGDTNSRQNALQRAMAFQSPNPHFTIRMTATYVCGSAYLDIPAGFATSYFHNKGNNSIYFQLNGADGKTWPMEYVVVGPPQFSVSITSGWKKFSQENNLQIGDTCAFELVNSRAMVFNVTLFRITDEGEVDPPLMTDIALPHSRKISAREAKQKVNADKGVSRVATSDMKRVLKKNVSKAKML